MSIEKLYEIDRRALDCKISLRALSRQAKVGSATMARFRAEPDKVNPRTVNKLIRELEKLEAENATIA